MTNHYSALLAGNAAIATLDMPWAFCVKYGDASVTVDATDEVSLVVNLSEGHSVIRRNGPTRIQGRPKFGAVTVVPPGDGTTFHLRGVARILLLRVPWAAVTRLAGEAHGYAADCVWVSPRFTELDLILSRLAFRVANHAVCSENVVSRLVSNLLNGSGHHQAPDPKTYHAGLTALQLRRVTERIEEDDHPLELKSLAAEAGLSPFHFAREFRRTTGLAPHRYVLQRRLARAVKLLAEPKRAVADVAAAAGFSHASHLARHLRRATGMSPHAFRQRLLLKM